VTPELPVERLGDLVDASRGVSYGIVQPGEHQPDGIPIVRVSDLKGDAVETTKPLRVAQSIEAAHARTRLRGGELIMSIVGTVGQTAIVDSSLQGWNVARAVAVIPVRYDIGPYWIRLALKGGPARSHIQDRLNTTVQATLNLRDLASLPIVLPPTAEREAIAATLGALDDKIELNRKMNATLEAMARALFRDWFVDFGPTRAKMEDRAPYLSPDLWSLFPERLDDEGKPEGWEVSPLDALADVTMGISPEGSTYNDVGEGTPLCNGPVEYGDFFLRQIKWTTAPSKLAQRGDLIICVRGSTTGRHAFADAEYCLGRGVASIRGKDDGQEFIETALLSQMNRLLEKTTGSVFPSLSTQDIRKFGLVDPSRPLRQAFCKAVQPMRTKIWANVEESRTLAQTRDLLLPRLMSGEIRVIEAERVVEAAQ
jgi:type I restriction enzyme S subunit